MTLSRTFITVWLFILGVHLLVLLGIGQIAFTKQYFNEADNMLGDFLKIKEELNQKQPIDEETATLINSLIEQASNSAGDLQELASQSFNIILGALLAFLSASSTVIFQELQKSKASENNPASPSLPPNSPDPDNLTTEHPSPSDSAPISSTRTSSD